jgi:hypothetical protein
MKSTKTKELHLVDEATAEFPVGLF